MTRPVVAIVTGFTKSKILMWRSLKPLRDLKQKGVIDRILYVTWDTPKLDDMLAPLAEMPDIELVRVPEPAVCGSPVRCGIAYQIRNLEAALACVPDEDALIVKLRPEFCFDDEFLEDKIRNFDTLCAPSDLPQKLEVAMPPSPFKAKIWLPWADANQPFFYEDAAFMGLKGDVAQLADRKAERQMDVLSEHDTGCGWLAHVARYATVFAPHYPIFDGYLSNFRLFPKNQRYRSAMLRGVAHEGFFWNLLLAHAWILATNFHVDCGTPGQLTFYTNTYNRGADWSVVDSLRIEPPYNAVDMWREGQEPGLRRALVRPFDRLVDDAWVQNLFTQPVVTDVRLPALCEVLGSIAATPQGGFGEPEASFYRRLTELYSQYHVLLAA